MLDRFFAPLLTFVLLIGASIAFVSTVFLPPREPVAPAPQVQAEADAPIVFEPVIVTGQRPS